MEKGFSERKGQQSKLAFTIHRTFFPAGRVWLKHHILRLYLRLQRWMKDVMLFWKSWEISLRNVPGGVKRDVMNVNQMMHILLRNFWGFVCVSFADYFPTALINQAVTPLEEDDDGDEEDTSTVQPHTGNTTAKSNTSQNGKSSLRYYVITSSPANMPGQWHEPGRTAGHSTSMCPVLFITLQFCSSYFFSYLFLILNITLLDIIHTSHSLVNFTAYVIKQKRVIYSY